MKSRNRPNGLVRAIRKFFLTAFVLISFGAYALENRVTGSGPMPAPTAALARAAETPTGTAPSSTPAAPPAEATATSGATSTTSSGYKDGTFKGTAVDVNWGYVQVQATIQSGKISNVQFLQYPNDRRTSVRINSIADPELQQEAIQAQSANVDIITGATLTSEGFQMSLQDALSQAQS